MVDMNKRYLICKNGTHMHVKNRNENDTEDIKRVR